MACATEHRAGRPRPYGADRNRGEWNMNGLMRVGVIALSWVWVCTPVCVEAAVKVASARNEEGSAEFKFKEVASPSKTDLGNRATFSVVGGRVDGNSGGVATLNDGRWPAEADQPSS